MVAILIGTYGYDQRPDIEKTSLGRFLAEQDGYLETTDFTQGRLILISFHHANQFPS